MTSSHGITIEMALQLANSESRPWPSMYVTADVRNMVRITNTSDQQSGLPQIQRRMINRITGQEPRETAPEIRGIRLDIANGTRFSVDSAICFQLYCDYKTPGNMTVSHDCGWCSIAFSEIASSNDGRTSFRMTIPVTDTGPERIGSRGTLTLGFTREFQELVSKCIHPSDTSIPLHKLWCTSAVQTKAIEHDVEKRAFVLDATVPLIPTFPLLHIPLYVACGRGVITSSIAFIADLRPVIPENFMMYLLNSSLIERYPTSKDRALSFITDKLDQDEECAVLSRFATHLSASCDYVFDLVISRGRLVLGDRYDRNSTETMTLDCEDATHNALVILDSLLNGTYRHPALLRLQRIRARYVACMAFKNVTTASAGMARDIAALIPHVCCDLVPIQTLISALGRRSILNDILEHRKSSGLVNDLELKGLNIMLCEGTAHVTQYNKHCKCGASPNTKLWKVRDMFDERRLNVDVLVNEDDVPSSFYVHAITLQLSDTLQYARAQRLVDPLARWQLPEVLIGTANQHGKFVYGLPHEKYLSSTFDALAVPDVSKECEDSFTYLEKFQPPLFFPVLPTQEDEYMPAIRTAIERVTAALSPIVKPKSTKGAPCAVYINLEHLSTTVVTELSSLLSRPALTLTNFKFQQVVVGRVFVILFVLYDSNTR